MEIKLLIDSPELIQALNNLATAISSTNATEKKTRQPKVDNSAPAPAPAPAVEQVTPQVPINAVPVTPQVPTNPIPQQPVITYVNPDPAIPSQYDPRYQPITPQTPPPPNPGPVTPQQPPTVPTTAVSYTMEQLAVASTQLVDAGKIDAVRQLLSYFGVGALTQLQKERYGEYATKLRELGAKL